MSVKYETANLKRLIVVPVLLIFLMFQNISSGDERNNVIVRRFPTKFKVKFEIKLTKNTMRFPEGSRALFNLACAIPTSNVYHEVGEITTNQGEIVKFDNSNQRIVRVVTENKLPDNIVIEYDISVYRIHVDLDKIRTIYPYNKNSDLYKNNTGAYRNVDPNHPEIIRLGNIARAKSGNLLEYAINAYKELKNRIKYKTIGKYDTLTNIFNNNGGDCAAHSTALISLYRNNGIPARYIIGGIINKNNGFDNHVWVEFYLERYGWIPADAAMTFSIPYIGYFNGLALGFYRGNKFHSSLNGEPYTLGGTQNISMRYRYWRKRPVGDYDYNKKFTISIIQPSNIEATYNSAENNERITGKLFQKINDYRQEKRLNSFTYSKKLSEILSNKIKTKIKTGEDTHLATLFKDNNYVLYGYYYWWMVQGDLLLDNIKEAYKSLLKSNAMNNQSLTEVGIGYYYSEHHGGHNYLVAFTRPKATHLITVKDLKKRAGESFYFDCPANFTPASVWGTDVYTADSSICSAALHSGAIERTGGKVKITVLPGRNAYTGSERNGITSKNWGRYESSFRVERYE